MSSNFLSLILLKLSFSSFVYYSNSKLNNPTIHLTNNVILSHVDSARTLCVSLIKICYFHNIIISAVCKSCFHYIRDLKHIRNTIIVQTTACTIATSLIHCRIDYCNSATQTNLLQRVLNSAVRTVTKSPKFHHITPILKSFHWQFANSCCQCQLRMYSASIDNSSPTMHVVYIA